MRTLKEPLSQARWWKSLVLALRKQRKIELCKFQANLIYIVPRPPPYSETLSQKQTERNFGIYGFFPFHRYSSQ